MEEVPTGTVRLIGGLSIHEGHVQMYLFGHWASMCSYSWDFLDAVVACRQLGYVTALASVRQNDVGGRSDLMWPFRLECTGFETNLTECSKYQQSSCPSASYKAGVICSSELEAHAVMSFYNIIWYTLHLLSCKKYAYIMAVIKLYLFPAVGIYTTYYILNYHCLSMIIRIF